MNPAARWALYGLILLSGAAGLVYEVVWARQLTLFIGNTAVANAAVLTAFMAGLALGSIALGRVADRLKSPIRVYALLEILIGVYGATTPWLFTALQAGYAELAGAVGVAGAWSHLPRFMAATIAMLVPTFLMGGTLPLLVRHFADRPERSQSVTSRIYGINTLGATAGAFCAGFVLLPWLGITETLLSAAVVNVLVGLGVLGLLARGKAEWSASEQPPPEAGEADIPSPAWLLGGFALSGFAALLYQVVWIHALVLVIGVSIYAFSTVLTVFLAGIGLGALLVGRIAGDRPPGQILRLACVLQGGIALAAIVSLSLISQLPILFVQGWAKLHGSFALFQSYTFVLAGLVIIVPTLLLGALFPLITGLWSRRRGGVGRGVGEAYGANALGTIAGSAIGGLFILDWLGIEGSLYLASAVSLGVAGLFWYLSCPERPFNYRLWPLPLAILLSAGLIHYLPGLDHHLLQTQVFRHANRYQGEDVRATLEEYLAGREFLYYEEGIHGTVSVIGWQSDGQHRKAIVNNGKVDASTGDDMATQVLLGQVPMFLHDSPEDVMVIGLGSGITAGSVLQTDAVRSLDLVEISPEVVNASRLFSADNHDVLNQPRTRLILADARNLLLASDKKYDVIISEPSHSWVTGVSNLFTREFLAQAARRLNDDGILVQWYHIYNVDRDSLRAMLKAVSDVFPHYTLWYIGGGDIIIASSREPLRLDYRRQAAFFDSPAVRGDLARIGVDSVEEFMNYILMSSAQTERLLVGARANTDEHPVVEFNAPRFLYTATTGDNVRMLFGELDHGEYDLPFDHLVVERGDWIDVPFMGLRLDRRDGGYSNPEWTVVRRSLPVEDSEEYRLVGGMKGEIELEKPWGVVRARSTMTRRDAPGPEIIRGLLEDEVPADRAAGAGEMKAPGITVYWRAGPSSDDTRLRVVLARKCERSSGFDNWVSIAGGFPGNAESREDTAAALRAINALLRCIPDV